MKTVLIVAKAQDIHAQLMVKALERRGRNARFLQVTRFANPATISFRPGRPADISITDVDHQVHLPGDISTVWYRRQGRPNLPEDMVDTDDRQFALREWDQVLDGILDSLNAKFVNAIGAQRAAVKPRQLTIAAACGLHIPDTLITSDYTAAMEFIDLHRGGVIHKTMSAPRHQFAATQRWCESDRAALGNLVLAPVMFQEEITGHSDIRAAVVGDRILAARVESSPGCVDSRLFLDAPCEPWTLPAPISAAVLRMMEALGLLFGVIDMKITHNNEYVFFEVNPQGQFLYVEMLTGLPITDALADLLLT
jgi:hypothetical protein